MLRTLSFPLVLGTMLATVASNAQAPAAATSLNLKDKIVFVRADPNIGLASQRGITQVDQASGSVTGSISAPEMNTMAANDSRKDELELMNPDGSAITPLHVFGADPMLSPDGTKIVYCSGRNTNFAQIYVVKSDGTAAKRLTNTKIGDACGPAWSRDGKKIAYHAFAQTEPSRNPEIWVMDADGSNPKRLTDHGIDPTWSPDGKQIAFASHRDGVFQIYVMNADGTNLRRLTKGNAESSNPAWAPDGGAIAYISATGDDRRGLYLMGSDGSEPHGVAHSKHQDFCFPSWSPDGRTLVFSALTRLGPQGIVVNEEKPRCEQWSGEYQIFAMDSEGKIKQLTDTKVMGTRPSYGRIAAP